MNKTVILLLLTFSFYCWVLPAQTDKVMLIESPAGSQSGQPFLSSIGERVYLSWQESLPDGGHTLRFSIWDGKHWMPSKTIMSEVPFFVNWADFPSMLPMSDGSLVAHWLAKSGENPYAYDVWISVSKDGGNLWSRPLKPHRDQTKTEHGFVSLVDRGHGQFSAIWLDGRNFKPRKHLDQGEENEMSLMFTSFRNNSFELEQPLDLRVCDCCQTSMAATTNGLFVVYRDRSPSEVRDISYVRFFEGEWTKPRTLHVDGWKINACPVNGPAVSAYGSNVVVAWYTHLNRKGSVRATFSQDEGSTFGPMMEVDDGDALGRVDVEWHQDGSALVVWLKRGRGRDGTLVARRVRSNGSMNAPFVVAHTKSSRTSGFPRMTRSGDSIFVAWTEPKIISRVRVAQITR